MEIGEGSNRTELPIPSFAFSALKVLNFHLPEVHHMSRETNLSTPALQFFLHRVIVLRAR